MSEQNAPTALNFSIAGQTFPAALYDVPKQRREKGADGKTKVIKFTDPIAIPSMPTITAAGLVFTSLCNVAEEREAGTGLKLAIALLVDKLEEAYDGAFNEETNVLDPEKWSLIASTAERPRNHGANLEAINAELADLALEMAVLQQAAQTPTGWTQVKLPNGEQRFRSTNEFALRLAEVINKINNTSAQRAQLAEAQNQRRAAREAKAAAAKEAANKAAAVAAGEAAQA